MTSLLSVAPFGQRNFTGVVLVACGVQQRPSEHTPQKRGRNACTLEQFLKVKWTGPGLCVVLRHVPASCPGGGEM